MGARRAAPVACSAALAFLGLLTASPVVRADGRPAEPPPAEPSPPPSTPDAPVATPARRDDAAPCDEAWVGRVYESSKRSVVRITRPDGGLGAGFLFFSSRHVATAFHVVDLGRGVTVELLGGARIPATVVATDPERDLAILELERPVLDARPLSLRFEVTVGTPVLAIGHPHGDFGTQGSLKGLLNHSGSRGMVSAVTETLFQTDAMLSPGNSGGPLLGCDGAVLGVASLLLDNKIGFAVRPSALFLLSGKIGEQRPFDGIWDLREPSLGLLLHTDVDDWAGAYVSVDVIGKDRFVVGARTGLVVAFDPETRAPLVHRRRYRVAFELTMGYRILLFGYTFPTYVVPSIGLAAAIDRGSETRLGIEYDQGAGAASPCPGAPACAPRLAATTTSIRGGGALPMAGIELRFLSVALGYAYQLDVIHPKLSTQRALFGVVF